jgi:1-acyl-sn-glycerol-3-phosphate acyltransferase
VALGVGLGSPLAGWLSGGKVELGLVPLGAVGMVLATLFAAFTLHWEPGLITCIIFLGFFVGFYFVPLYALLQYRAPKSSKGDLIATSNFINVTGAILASVFFASVVWVAHRSGLTPELTQQDDFARGTLVGEIEYENGRPIFFEVKSAGPDGKIISVGRHRDEDRGVLEDHDADRIAVSDDVIQVGRGLSPGTEVIVSTFELPVGDGFVRNYRLRAANRPLTPVYNNDGMPRLLFIGASMMTLGMLLLLCRQLPDFFIRSLLWLRSYGRFSIKVYGIQRLPTESAAILATNCQRFQECMHVLACTDRTVKFILVEEQPDETRTPLLRYLAKNTGMLVLKESEFTAEQITKAAANAVRTLEQGELVALSIDRAEPEWIFERMLAQIVASQPVEIVPVYCGSPVSPDGQTRDLRRVRVVIGEPLPGGTSAEEVRRAVLQLERWLQEVGPVSDLAVK